MLKGGTNVVQFDGRGFSRTAEEARWWLAMMHLRNRSGDSEIFPILMRST